MKSIKISWSLIAACVVALLIVGGGIAFLIHSGVISIGGLGDERHVAQLDEASFQKEVELLSKVKPEFAPIREFFVNLADEKGGVYAFDVLKRIQLPPNTDLHLLGHAVGDELYKQEGLDGMKFCTHDLRNACSHSIVVGALLENGLSVFDRVNEVCKQAPGGPGAYTMCFHGFGHGVLAYAEYEVPDAVELCGKVGTDEYFNEESAQCIGGMIMEMHQGIHDPETWAEKRDKYLSPDDPLRLCQEDYMPDEAKVLCYSYITPYIFDSAGSVNGNPSPEIYPKSFAYCDEVENERHRRSCYGGLGKEFIVLAQDRDIRKMDEMTDERLELAASWCMLAEKEEAQSACLSSILDSLYWGGENDPETSVRYCSLLEGVNEQLCFDHLFDISTYYQPDPKIRATICSLVPSTYTQQCEDTLLQ